MTITVYTKPACVQCSATFRTLDKAGAIYTKVDVTQDSAAREFVQSLGYLQAPVVVLSDGTHFGGFRIDALKAAAAAQTGAGQAVTA